MGMTPDYVLIGHLSLDRSVRGERLGGTAYYAGRAARLLGRSVGIVTSAPPGLEAFSELADCEVVNVRSDNWTSFENMESAGRRTQKWLSSASQITLEDVPSSWHKAPIVHFAPIAQELSPDFALGCPAGVCAASVQGWLRGRSSSDGVLVEVNADLERALRYLDVAIMSSEDVAHDRVLVQEFANAARILVVTNASDGCDVFRDGQKTTVSTDALRLASSVGAGDAFSAAFVVAFRESDDAVESARFANRFAGWILQDPERLNGAPGSYVPEISAKG